MTFLKRQLTHLINLDRPHFGFKNRLFVERNNKHPRITNNLSTTFRSSKWAPMSMKNITSRFNEIFHTLKARPLNSVILLVFIYYLLDYVTGLPALKFALSFTWTQLDSAFQITTQWLMLKYMLLVQTTQGFFYKWFKRQFFGSGDAPEETSLIVIEEETAPEETSLIVIEEETRPALIGVEKQWVFLNYLTKSDSQWLKSPSIIKVFNNRWEASSFSFSQTVTLLKTLFGSVNLLRVEDFTRSGRRLVSDLKKIATRGTPLNDVLRFILAKPGREKPSYRQRLIMEREINRFVPRSKELARNNPSTRFIKSLGETGLESLFDEGSFGYKLVRTPLNPFTLPNSNEVKRLTQSNLNSDIVPLKRAARLSSTFVEHQRRLYRFSLFHRAILKNSHKITNAKRLITSGFYDSSLTANNLWVSELFNRSFGSNDAVTQTVKHLLRQTNGLSGQHLCQSTFLSNSTDFATPALSLNTLNLFEKSYFWNLKRFYNFNTSHSVTQALGLIRASEDVAVTPRSNSKCTELDLIQSSALKSYTLTNPGLTEKQLLNTKLSPSCTAEDASKDVYTQEDVSAIFNLTNSTIVHDVLTSKDTSDIQTRHFSSFVDSTKYLDTSLEELTTLKDLNDVPSDAKPVDPTSKSYATVNDRILMRDLLLITKIQNKRK